MAVFNTFQIDAGPHFDAKILQVYTPDELAAAVNLFDGYSAPVLSAWGAFTDDEEGDFQIYQARSPHAGYLVPGPFVFTRFVMRAFKTTLPTGHVYWEVFDVPDPEGSEAPFSPYDLVDIVVVAEFCD